MAGLSTYRKKRDFGKTAEPRGKAGRKRGFQYVIQKHAATRLHYDLRLELDGVMLSWAVTRGPSLVAGEKRLSIHVEDHPVEYNTFEGTIPKGQYGGGTVMVWDRGTWAAEHDAHRRMKKGHLEFVLNGDKLQGRWHLIRLKPKPGERQEPWLLIKADDEHARSRKDPDILDEQPNSAASGRSLEDINTGKSRVWQSNRPVSEQSKTLVAADKKPGLKRLAGESKATSATRTASKTAKKLDRPGKTSVHSEQTLRAVKKAAVRAKKAAPSPAKNKRHTPADARNLILAGIPGSKKSAMPEFVPPSLATLAAKAPAGSNWVHEIKFDGYRMQAQIDADGVTLRTRTGLDWTARFPTVARACKGFAGAAILDGEIVSGNAQGISDFSALQDDLKSGRQDRLAYYVFDLLHLDGFDLTGTPLLERKEQLAQLFGERPTTDVVRLSEHFEEDGATLLAHARSMGLEGILAKQADAPYRSGRTDRWLKVKCSDSQEFVIVGYEPSDKTARTIRSLVVGYYDGRDLRYAGRVGTGWGGAMERTLVERIAPLEVERSLLVRVPAEENKRNVRWLKPSLVAEVEFRGWTGSQVLRQASFKGLREDKPAKQVRLEKPRSAAIGSPEPAPPQQQAVATRKTSTKRRAPVKKAASSRPAAKTGKAESMVAGVRLTNPDRVYWEDTVVTKAELARYYETVWDWMSPHVTGRVLSLVRCPDGAAGQCFYQKHASAGIDDTHLRLVDEPDGERSITIERLDGLIALAQSGVLEVHVRGSRAKHLEKADRLVFDLDPGPGIEWADIVEGARHVRKRLAALSLDCFVKTTGGKGLHVVVPIAPAPWEDVKAFCRGVAERMAAEQPERYTATIKKAARGNRIFVDYLRNSREATAAAPFSTRARPGAPVSAPVTWTELGRIKAADQFTVKTMPARLARLKADPWAGIETIQQKLPKTP